MSFLNRNKLLKIGFAKIGNDCQISERAVFYSPENISIGNNVRVDDFCILSAGSEIIIGDWVHVACYTSLIGKGRIELKDFSGVSMRCSILSSNADYSGMYLTNPQIPEKYLNTLSGPVTLEKHALVGAGSVVLPGLVIGAGAVVGALSLVKRSIPDYEVWGGVPAKNIEQGWNCGIAIRNKKMLNLENQLRNG